MHIQPPNTFRNHFWKNRIFWIFDFENSEKWKLKIVKIPFWLQKDIKKCKIAWNMIGALTKKIFHVRSSISLRNQIFHSQTIIYRFGPKMHKYRFRPLKTLKSQKFFDFRKVFISRIILISWFVWISLAIQKI